MEIKLILYRATFEITHVFITCTNLLKEQKYGPQKQKYMFKSQYSNAFLAFVIHS